MRRMMLLSPVVLTVFLAGLVVGAIGIVIVEAHGGDSSLIHACVNPAGRLRIVGPSDACSGNEVALDWNVQGPAGSAGADGADGAPGPAGADGADGAPGPAGADGADGVSGHQIVTVNSPSDSSVGKSATAACPEGKSVLGGGVFPIGLAFADHAVSYSGPLDSDSWRALGVNRGADTDVDWSLAVYAICATVE